MIHEIAQRAVNTGFREAEALTDETGAYAYRLTKDGDVFYLVTKEYAFKGLASFILEVVEKAASENGYLVFYRADEDETFVFDGKYVESFARPSSGASKTREAEWRELELDAGCRLGAFLRGEDSPETLAGKNRTLLSY